jgi:hypothetical protein
VVDGRLKSDAQFEIGVVGIHRLSPFDEFSSGPPTSQIVAGVDEDAIEERPERRVAPEGADALIEPDESLLDGVFCIFAPAQKPLCNLQHAGCMPVTDLSECAFVARLAATDQLFLVHAVACGF